jgi:hypothetical protein
MESRAFVTQRLPRLADPLLTGTQRPYIYRGFSFMGIVVHPAGSLTEVFSRFGNKITVELEYNAPNWLSANRNVEKRDGTISHRC